MTVKKRKVRSSSKPLKLIPVKVSGATKTRRHFNAKTELMTYNQPTYTDAELEYFEDAWATTPAGLALDKRMEFVWLGGVKPIFELKEEDDKMSEEQKKNKLKKINKVLGKRCFPAPHKILKKILKGDNMKKTIRV